MVLRSFRAALLVGALLVGQAVPAFAACPTCARCCGMQTRVYPAADLIVPVGSSRGDKPASQEDRLVHTIQSTVCPKTWACAGGAGTIEYHPLTLSLVVNQTPEVHTHLVRLLADMRKQMDIQVAMEMRILHVSEELLETLGLEPSDGTGIPGVAMLSDTQVHVLMDKVQQDKAGNILQAPKLTMFNGQKATIDLSDKQAFVSSVDVVPVDGRKTFHPRVQTTSSGFKVTALPTVSADRRFIKLQLNLEMGSIDSPVPTGSLTSGVVSARGTAIQLEKTLVIPDGQTAMLSGWTTQREVRNETTPILGKVPYLSRLFQNIGYGRMNSHMLVLVTPRLLVLEEEEEGKPATKTAPVSAGEAECEPESPETATNSETKPKEDKQKEDKPEAKDIPGSSVATLYVRDRKFQLTYDLDNVGTSQVKHIEVWWTKDTKTWDRFADDVKPTGKVVIAVKEEGTYGFKLNARSGAGLSAPAPKAGDLPHTWVVVDVTPPTVKLEPVVVTNTNDGEVVIKWTVKDDHLDPRPVTLRYSEKPEGPWKELVVRGAAEDTYRCPVPKLPSVCYFRIDAVDKSGNVGTAWTTEPVKVDLKVPVIRNVNVKPMP